MPRYAHSMRMLVRVSVDHVPVDRHGDDKRYRQRKRQTPPEPERRGRNHQRVRNNKLNCVIDQLHRCDGNGIGRRGYPDGLFR